MKLNLDQSLDNLIILRQSIPILDCYKKYSGGGRFEVAAFES